ncbi:hypothetical protein DPMN_121428 [Dreissena polymorpha]|uniref:Secreted protein n=1 Tax=Dreissena polymorpha TaxID=45954 RepID=A0A9D4GMF2_DREPO|nr:hypothetical protein DPMN_121428 [Dreissena polymorpha]
MWRLLTILVVYKSAVTCLELTTFSSSDQLTKVEKVLGSVERGRVSPRLIDVILKGNFWWARPMLIDCVVIRDIDCVVIRDFQGSSANSDRPVPPYSSDWHV